MNTLPLKRHISGCPSLQQTLMKMIMLRALVISPVRGPHLNFLYILVWIKADILSQSFWYKENTKLLRLHWQPLLITDCKHVQTIRHIKPCPEDNVTKCLSELILVTAWRPGTLTVAGISNRNDAPPSRGAPTWTSGSRTSLNVQ